MTRPGSPARITSPMTATPCAPAPMASAAVSPEMPPSARSFVSPSGTAHMPAGLLIHYGGHLIYHLGDTALFSDLKLVARRGDKVELALVPIGGHFTMDRYDAVTAVVYGRDLVGFSRWATLALAIPASALGWKAAAGLAARR